MDRNQLRIYIIEPTLHDIPKGYSPSSDIAIQMIIAHESQHGKYIKQIGGGPALGPIQMEPTTHDSVWKEGDSIWKNAVEMGIITLNAVRDNRHPPAERLLYDMRYNVFMARQRLFMKPEAFPEEPADISKYLKKHWNTVKGRATDSSYLNAWLQWD